MSNQFRDVIRQQILVGDGAMGTFLYQMGFPVGISYEELNLTRPEAIAEVHRLYYEAGSRVIETNTFSANREKLSKFGLESDMAAINKAGVEIARQAVGSDAFVLGAVGSIRAGKRKNIPTEQVKKAFKEQIEVLLHAGVDGLVLETFYDLEEMLLAVSTVKKFGDIPIVAQFATEGVGRTQDGYEMSEAFQRLIDEGVDVLGFNCRSGPNGIIRTIEQLQPNGQIPLSVFPNAGIPDYVDGRYTYMATPNYFAENAVRFAELGAHLIGGCCGTTPEHIAAIASAVQKYVPTSTIDELNQQNVIVVESSNSSQRPTITGDIPPVNQTILDWVKERHTVIVELDPPRDLDITKFMEGSAALHASGADAITMADNSLAMTRMSNIALGSLIKEKIGANPLVHIACRDRNLIGTQSHLMGLHALNIHHVLAVTGDPARFGDLPGSSSVYDLTSFEIIRMIKQLNEGIAFSGKPLKQKAQFVVGAAFNPNVKYLDKAVKRLEKKIESGADYIMTQPVYNKELIVQIYEATKHLPVPVFIGIMPLASGRNAEYLHNEVPGIQLSDEVRERMRGLEGPQGREVGQQIARELLDTAMQYFNGIYLITPFMLYEMTVDLTKYVVQNRKAR